MHLFARLKFTARRRTFTHASLALALLYGTKSPLSFGRLCDRCVNTAVPRAAPRLAATPTTPLETGEPSARSPASGALSGPPKAHVLAKRAVNFAPD